MHTEESEHLLDYYVYGSYSVSFISENNVIWLLFTGNGL